MRIVGDCREVLRDLPKGSVQCCVTSPPYWGLRDYGVKRQIGLERTPELFIEEMVKVFRLVREVLADDGTLWLNLGDSYVANGSGPVPQTKSHVGSGFAGPNRNGMTGLKPKDLCGMPWRVAFALQADGWYLRSDIIWHKPNPMPESVTDRPTKAHEYLFLLTKRSSYFYDAEAVREPHATADFSSSGHSRVNSRAETAEQTGRSDGFTRPARNAHNPAGRNRRTVWTIATSPFPGAHFATFPPKLVEPCILAGTSEKGHCPECGARWVRVVEREFVPTQDPKFPKGGQKGLDASNGWGETPRGRTATETLGFRPTCTCNRKPVPDVVLDPFFGAGTVGMVAEQLGRDYVGIELNARYSRLAREAA